MGNAVSPKEDKGKNYRICKMIFTKKDLIKMIMIF